MGFRVLRVTADLFVDLCKDGPPFCCRVVRNALPADARFVRAGHDGYGTLQLIVESAEWPDMPAGHQLLPVHPEVVVDRLSPGPLDRC